MQDSTKPGDTRRQRKFHTTSWSLIVQANENDSAVASDALAQLCEAYWYPLYAFVRCKGFSVMESEDITQSFFSELLVKDTIGRADQDRGKFRSFLLGCLANFLRNYRRRENAEKRGGQKLHLTLDFETAENQFQNEPHHSETPERIYDRSWALALLHQVMQNLEQQYIESGKQEWFEHLQPYIAGEGDQTYADLGRQLNLKEGAVKLAIFRLRERYGQQLRLQIAKTTAGPEQVDDELRHLLRSLGG